LKGYSGRILRVDLTAMDFCTEELNDEIARKYIGGSGLAAKMLWDETTADTDPLSSENRLIFMTGPLTGTPTPSSSRFTACAISPLTNIWGEAHCGGTWGDELKHAGLDGVVIQGKASRPACLWIDDEHIRISEASHLWGRDTFETTNLLKKETEGTASVVTIGPAGERLVRIASIMTEGTVARAAARCGLGAVMGSKKLKAVVVRGRKRPLLYDEPALIRDVQNLLPRLKKHLADDGSGFHDLSHLRRLANRARKDKGNYPVRNWSQGTFSTFIEKEQERISSLTKMSRICRGCMSGCSHCYVTDKGKPFFFEAVCPLGSNCLVDDFDALIDALEICNRLGIDCISAGGVVAFAMECFEKGLVSLEDTGRIDLRWGSAEALIKVIRKIGEREGFGELLGEGVRRAAERIGGGAQEFAIHVKGNEFPAHNPRAHFAAAIEYATSNRGAHHKEGSSDWLEKKVRSPELGCHELLDRFETNRKGEMCAKMQDFLGTLNSLVSCIFLFSEHSIQPSDFVRWLNYVTGMGFDLKEYLTAGERIFNLKRIFNMRRGIRGKDDTLPSRILTQRVDGPAGNPPRLKEMLCEYYAYRGWDDEGIPTRDTLKKLELLELAERGGLRLVT